MASGSAVGGRWSDALGRILSPFETRAPVDVREDLLRLQFERLRTHMPVLCLALVLTAVAATLALLGEIPWYFQFTPPAIIIIACIALFFRWRRRGMPSELEGVERIFRNAPSLAGGLGLIAGFWCVSAFAETEKYYCVVAPVFVALSVLMAANCLASLPNVATVAVTSTISPIAVKMLIFDNLGIRCIAVMMIVIGAMQLRLIYDKFDETVRMIILQREMKALAATDALTALDNRRAFAENLEAALDEYEHVTLAMLDLDGFKHANDTYGHHAGDRILVEVAARLKQLCAGAASIARLGGDEFAIVFVPGLDPQEADDRAGSIRTLLALPYAVADDIVTISASIGIAHSPEDGTSMFALLQSADRVLYAEKGIRQEWPASRAAAA